MWLTLWNLFFILAMIAVLGYVVRTYFPTFAKKEGFDTKKPTLIKFYAKWCGHCTAMAGAWNEASNALKNEVIIINADVDDDQYSSLFKEHNVTSFPTIKCIDTKGEVHAYSGDRSASSIIEFARSHV